MLTEHRQTIDRLQAADDIPVLTGLQRQGDVLVIPTAPGQVAGLVDIPPAGTPAVQGQHTHLLVGDGAYAARNDGIDLGTLVVRTEVWMLHDEHGGNAIGPGTYLLRGKQEMAEQIRRVAD